MVFLTECASKPHLSAVLTESRKKASDLLGLRLKTVVSHPVGAGN